MSARTGCALKMVALAAIIVVALSPLAKFAEGPSDTVGGPFFTPIYMGAVTLLVMVAVLAFYTRRE